MGIIVFEKWKAVSGEGFTGDSVGFANGGFCAGGENGDDGFGSV